MLEIYEKNARAADAEKAADARFAELIQELVVKKGAESALGKGLLMALGLAQDEQQRRINDAEPYKSLKQIFAEYLFEDPQMYRDPQGLHDNALETEALAGLLKAAEEAQFDPLTQVYNRRKVTETLDKWLTTNREQEKQQEFAVVMIDLDNFKSINDRFGHPVGDEVLKKVAELLVHTFRRTDVIGRWGGEEFVVLMQATAAQVEEKLNNLWQSLQSELATSRPMQVTASIGWTMHSPGTQDTTKSLTKAADDAMYQAKNLGRNRVVKFEPLV